MGKLGMKRMTDEMQGRGQGSTGTRRFVTQHCPLDIVRIGIVILFVSHDEKRGLLWGCSSVKYRRGNLVDP